MTVYFGSDHAGFELKNELLVFVRDELGYDVNDCGAHAYDSGDDFVEYVQRVAEEVSKNEDSMGVILGGSGQGEAMCANRYAGVRATTYYHHDLDIVRLSREHNNANIFSIGARFIVLPEAKEALALWLHTPFTHEERHVRRIKKLG